MTYGLYAIATVNEDGEPHVTPIASLILGKPGHGLYFEEFTRQLTHTLKRNKQVCVLAVNSSRWFWIKSLISGRFSSPPAVRLHGTAGEIREATETEIKLWKNRHQISEMPDRAATVSYATAKHAVVGLSKSLRAEAALQGIRVSVFCPGYVRTAILEDGGKYGKMLMDLSPEQRQRMSEMIEKFKPMPPTCFC